MPEPFFDNELSAAVWRNKYRYRQGSGAQAESSVDDTWRRVAAAVATVEPHDQAGHARRFAEAMRDFVFLPAGRILAGAGTTHHATLFNCFVMDYIDDSVQGIFTRLKEAAITMQFGGGIGCDFSTLRPRGTAARTAGTIASGPVSFMRLWDSMCATVLSTGARRGAMMGTLRADHPDIEEFIDSKRVAGQLTNFNLSVQVGDDFLSAVEHKKPWPLVFPGGGKGPTTRIRWPGHETPVECSTHRVVEAANLWARIVDAAFDTAEPGILLVDRINRRNNLHYCEQITTTNPCGEIPLPANGACNLGSINLAQCVVAPFTRGAVLDMERIRTAAACATRFLDNVNDLSRFPLAAQAKQARGARRLGLGITGLADALIMLGEHYDSDAARETMSGVLCAIRDTAYETSIELAREKGSFPFFDKDRYLAAGYASELPPAIRDGISRDGIRNSHLIAIAPAGSISVLANNVSSGVEPVYALEMQRRVLNRDGCFDSFHATSYAYSQWRARAKAGTRLPGAFVTALELSAEAHLRMAAALQPLVDNSISKTVNVPDTIGREEFAQIYWRAVELGLNGCTVFKTTPIRGVVLSAAEPLERGLCCTPDREGD